MVSSVLSCHIEYTVSNGDFVVNLRAESELVTLTRTLPVVLASEEIAVTLKGWIRVLFGFHNISPHPCPFTPLVVP